MHYADQKLEPPCSTKANPTSRKPGSPTLGFPLYNIAYKTAEKKSCLVNSTELTLLLSSDEGV